MNPLDGLDPSELVAMADSDFQEKVKTRARALTAKAVSTIEDIMDNSDDDQARLQAAGKILNVAKVEQEDLRALPQGISPEVFQVALAGLLKLSGIARDTTVSQHLRDVTPARSDPRPFIADDSPLNLPLAVESQRMIDEATVIEENLQVEIDENEV